MIMFRLAPNDEGIKYAIIYKKPGVENEPDKWGIEIKRRNDMLSYALKPNKDNFVRVVVDTIYPDKIVLKFWRPKPDIEKIPLGESHYDIFEYSFTDRRAYRSILFNIRPATTARRYIEKMGYQVAKREY